MTDMFPEDPVSGASYLRASLILNMSVVMTHIIEARSEVGCLEGL